MVVVLSAAAWTVALLVGLWVWDRATSTAARAFVVVGLVVAAWATYTWVPRAVGDDLPDGAVSMLLLIPLLGLGVWRVTHRREPGTRE